MLVANQKLDKAATTADDSERMKKVDMNENIDWLFECLFYSILVNNKLSLYNEIWVKKAHLHAISGSLQGRPLDRFGRVPTTHKHKKIQI